MADHDARADDLGPVRPVLRDHLRAEACRRIERLYLNFPNENVGSRDTVQGFMDETYTLFRFLRALDVLADDNNSPDMSAISMDLLPHYAQPSSDDH